MVQFNPECIQDKEEFVDDMRQCLDYCNRIFSAAKDSSINDHTLLTNRESLQEKIKTILLKSLEEWRLVLKFVPDFMQISLNTLNHVGAFNPLFEMIMDFLRNLTVCIGVKRIGRYWPTEVEWLTRLVDWLEQYLSSYSHQQWTTVYTLVLWLSSAVKTPFDLKKFDTKDKEPISRRIIAIIDSLAHNFSIYSVVHILAAKFYSRPDNVSNIETFVHFITKDLSLIPVNDCVSHLRILSTLIKTVDRNVICDFVDEIVQIIIPMVASKHELITKLSIKILGRCALTKMKPKLFKLRYKCGKRITTSTEMDNSFVFKELKGDQVDEYLNDGDNDDDDLNLPEYFEQLIQLLLEYLNHNSTSVRYSVSKYLASICNRLPKMFSTEILQHLLALCVPTQNDLAWHGACLTFAELVRRGLVHVDLLPKVVDVTSKALFYEYIKGSFVLGSHVRDASAYICWSMARAYDSKLIGNFVCKLSAPLICMACFDTQLNCRRAASAVIQELAGRTQQFPHWIDVIAKTEFHDLSQIEYTYTELGVYFSKYDAFQEGIINHLFEKSVHWEPAIRRLSARTLGLISSLVPFKNTKQLVHLLESIYSIDLNVRHGSLLTLAHLILKDVSLKQNSDILKTIFEMIPSYETKNVFNTFGNDLTREACLVVIDHYCQTMANSLDSKLLHSWLDFILNSIQENDSNDLVQSCSINAAVSLCSCNPDVNCMDSLLKIVRSGPNQFSVSTISRLIPRLDLSKFETEITSVVDTLCQFVQCWFENPLRRSETIADSIKSIMKVVGMYDHLLTEQQRMNVYELVLRCLNDHTITNQGDTGMFVRIAVIESTDQYVRCLTTWQAFRLFQLISAEAAFHRIRSFRLSMTQLARLFPFLDENLQFTLKKDEHYRFLVNYSDDNQFEDDDLFQECVQLLALESLMFDLVSGFIFILSDPVMDKYSKLICDFIKSRPDEIRVQILENFLNFFNANCKCNRCSIPCLVSAHFLLSKVVTDKQFQHRLSQITWSACQNSLNPKKYLLACDIYCTLIALDNLTLVFPYLYVLLGHRLPRVRAYTSTELYTAILSLLDGSIPDQIGNDITTTLQNTDWLAIEEAKKGRNLIRDWIKSISSTN